MNTQTQSLDCPCCSGLAYNLCCEPLITLHKGAASPEQLMRSRYTAYTIADVDYLLQTTHPDTRQNYQRANLLDWANRSTWLNLSIIGSNNLQSKSEGTVEFVAHYKENEILKTHHEQSLFKSVKDVWFFHSGVILEPPANKDIGRNTACPCGSGKKYKRCCAY